MLLVEFNLSLFELGLTLVEFGGAMFELLPLSVEFLLPGVPVDLLFVQFGAQPLGIGQFGLSLFEFLLPLVEL